MMTQLEKDLEIKEAYDALLNDYEDGIMQMEDENE